MWVIKAFLCATIMLLAISLVLKALELVVMVCHHHFAPKLHLIFPTNALKSDFVIIFPLCHHFQMNYLCTCNSLICFTVATHGQFC
jgi:hypothetical protein